MSIAALINDSNGWLIIESINVLINFDTGMCSWPSVQFLDKIISTNLRAF